MRVMTVLKEEDLYQLLMKVFKVPRDRVLIRYNIEGPHDDPLASLEANIVKDIGIEDYILSDDE